MELSISGIDLPDEFECHFSNSRSVAAKRQIGENGVVTIPDEYFLSNAAQIFCWIYLHPTVDSGVTEYEIVIPLLTRPNVDPAEPTQEQQDIVDQAVAALNVAMAETSADAESASASATAAQAAVDSVLNMTVSADTLPSGSDASVTKSVVDDAVHLAFGIPQGAQGVQGEQGVQGPTGATPNFTIGTVQTLLPTQDATATITGTAEAPVLNLGIPKGYSGDATNLAADYSSNKIYAVGEYCIYNGSLYRCITPITTAETWTAAHWETVALADDVSEIKIAFAEFESQVSDSGLITIPRTNKNGYYIDSTGAVVSSSSNYQTTDPIDISAYNILYITGRANYTHLIYAFYDANNVFISGYASAGGESQTLIEDLLVIVPSNAKYIRISNLYNLTPYPNAKYIKYTITGLNEVEAKADSAVAGLSEITGEDSHQIDFLAEATFQSGYYNKSGTYYESASYVCSSKIPVMPGDNVSLIFHVSGNPGGFRFVTAYSDDTAVSAKGAENVGVSGYDVPEGINYIRISISGANTQASAYELHIKRTISEKTVTAQSETDNLFEKKWCVVGDSFSYGGQSPMPVFDDGWYKGVRKSYPYFIGNRTHINIIDFSANGRTLAYPADGTFSNSFTNPSNTDYFQNIPSDVDYITIYLGINDSHHAPGSSGGDGEDNTGEIPIGTIDDATTATFGGAWNVVLTWLITNRPNAHIGIIVSNGVDNVNYRNLTIAIAKKYGIAYIDLNGDERTPAMIRTVNPDIPQAVRTALINKWAVEVGVNTHPNTDAHEYESFFIENFLRSI